ncbi:MAG: hypothetical protein ISR51_02215 [Rhodospirillales bacterium]|nr:hypothetical protein [Alphaproteobacteria bacterium]MBL6947467.1 hypothetical protein [Rhodospirillales bacterium]
MDIQKQIAQLLYALADIQLTVRDERIRLLAEGMQITALEMECLTHATGPADMAVPGNPTIPSAGTKGLSRRVGRR